MSRTRTLAQLASAAVLTFAYFSQASAGDLSFSGTDEDTPETIGTYGTAYAYGNGGATVDSDLKAKLKSDVPIYLHLVGVTRPSTVVIDAEIFLIGGMNFQSTVNYGNIEQKPEKTESGWL